MFLAWGYNVSGTGTLYRDGLPTSLAITALVTVFGVGFAIVDVVEHGHFTGRRNVVFGRMYMQFAALHAWRHPNWRSKLGSLVRAFDLRQRLTTSTPLETKGNLSATAT